MMSRRFSALVVGLVLLGACGSSSWNSASKSSTTSTTRSSSRARGGSTLQIVRSKRFRGPVIANTWKRTVYMYLRDGSAKTNKVPASLKKIWPHVLAVRQVTVGPYLSRSKLALYKQPNGQEQVSYNGHLLYTFNGDRQPGDAKGQGLGKVWFALSASGEKVS